MASHVDGLSETELDRVLGRQHNDEGGTALPLRHV
jgi:hypothetical protein